MSLKRIIQRKQNQVLKLETLALEEVTGVRFVMFKSSFMGLMQVPGPLVPLCSWSWAWCQGDKAPPATVDSSRVQVCCLKCCKIVQRDRHMKKPVCFAILSLDLEPIVMQSNYVTGNVPWVDPVFLLAPSCTPLVANCLFSIDQISVSLSLSLSVYPKRYVYIYIILVILVLRYLQSFFFWLDLKTCRVRMQRTRAQLGLDPMQQLKMEAAYERFFSVWEPMWRSIFQMGWSRSNYHEKHVDFHWKS